MTQTISLVFRENNGQFSKMTKGISIESAIKIFYKEDTPKSNVLFNFSPIIEGIHKTLQSHQKEKIENLYSTFYNFWKDARTHSPEIIEKHKSYYLSSKSIELITECDLQLKHITSGLIPRQLEGLQPNSSIDEVEKYFKFFTIAILCFIHTKASIEISSFKNDEIITKYCIDTHNTLIEIIKNLTRPARTNEAILDLLRTGDIEIAELLLKNENPPTSIHQFMLESIQVADPYQDNYNYFIAIPHREIDQNTKELMKKILEMKNILDRIIELITKLKENKTTWDENENNILQEEELIKYELEILKIEQK